MCNALSIINAVPYCVDATMGIGNRRTSRAPSSFSAILKPQRIYPRACARLIPEEHFLVDIEKVS
jgi:hypothetical protein